MSTAKFRTAQPAMGTWWFWASIDKLHQITLAFLFFSNQSLLFYLVQDANGPRGLSVPSLLSDSSGNARCNVPGT